MGRSKAHKKTVRDTRGTSGTSQKASKVVPTVQSLLEEAQELVSQCDFDLAHQFVSRVLQESPHHIAAIELLGIVQLEKGDLTEARQTFQSLIPPSLHAPTAPPASAHLYLAQLSEEDPQLALKHYQTAIDILLKQLHGKERESTYPITEEPQEVKRMIVRALVSMVEIWMSDLCMDPDAEQNCDSLLQIALQTDPLNPEALQTLASVRLSQVRPDEAKEYAESAWATWKTLDPDSHLLPSIPSRLALARLFLELSLFSSALTVLSGVLASDDQNVEAWYLEGWCFYLMGEQAKETGQKVEDLTWEELNRDAWDCLDTCSMLHTNQGHPDAQLLQHTKQLISELESTGITPSVEIDEDTGVDSEWEDEDETNDVEMRP